MKSIIYPMIIALALLGSAGCIQNGQFGIRGEGPVVERKVTLDPIKGISLPGSAKIYITQGTGQEVRITGQENIIDNLNLEVRISGSGKMNLDLDAREIDANISGSGDLFIKGTADDLNFSIAGSGSVNASDLTAQKARVRISGSGGMKLMVEDRLDAHVSGSGSVLYKGNPRVDSSVSGSGSVRSY